MKATYYYENREFEVYAHQNMGVALDVAIYEVVRPTWKIFRSKFFPLVDTYFFIDDYPSIDDAIRTLIARKLAEEEREEECTKKVNDFFKNTY